MFCKIGMINYMNKNKIIQVKELNNSFGISIFKSDEMQDKKNFRKIFQIWWMVS